MSDAPIIIKKKKAHGHAHHGGSWKVAYADFVTAMWAFFMVMWIMGLSDDVKMKIQGYFNDPLGFMKNQPKSQSAFSVKAFPSSKAGSSSSKATEAVFREEHERKSASELKEKITKAVAQSADLKDLLKHVEITVTPEGLRIELLESTGAVFFESGRAEIKPDALELIKRIASVLATTNRSMIVEGHTDAKPYAGKDYTNWDLSTDRALALRRALAIGGVGEGQFLGVRGLAATQLRKPSDPFHYSNRRVSILLPFEASKDQKIDMPKVEEKSHVDGMFQPPLEIVPPRPKVVDTKK
jgi:chemotaxis protein MotB